MLPRIDSFQPFFVVGTAASGTTWLQHILNSHPEIVCKGEGMFFGDSKSREHAQSLFAAFASSNELKTWHNRRIWTEGKFEDFVPGLVRLVVDSLFLKGLEAKPGARVVGDKTPYYVARLGEIHGIYPDAKILHIIRDGRDVAVSNTFKRWRNSSDKGGPLQVPPKVLQKRDSFLTNPQSFLATGESIFTGTMLTRLAQKWSREVKKGIEAGHEHFGPSYMQTKYETLSEEPHRELTRLLDFLGVDDDPHLVNRIVQENTFGTVERRKVEGTEEPNSLFRKGVAGDWKNYFTEQDKRTFKDEAGELLLELSYERHMQW